MSSTRVLEPGTRGCARISGADANVARERRILWYLAINDEAHHYDAWSPPSSSSPFTRLTRPSNQSRRSS
jgi:hypothetical protein